ncbi:MAG: hypothetical protein ACOH2B_05570 [Burkholderiaceae bacterium]
MHCDTFFRKFVLTYTLAQTHYTIPRRADAALYRAKTGGRKRVEVATGAAHPDQAT